MFNGNKKKVVIAGGSGTIGIKLAEELVRRNFAVAVLTRNPAKIKKIDAIYWNPDKNEIEAEKISGADFIVNLAGANIADKRWTRKRKREILESRVNSARVLFELFKKIKQKPQAYVSASAVGYYGAKTTNKVFAERDKNGGDFLAKVCRQWEKAAAEFEKINVRTVIFRIGVVFAKSGGAFPKLTQLLKFKVINAVGTGKQIFPWIYIYDLVEMFVFAIENSKLRGVYNAVAPAPITFNDLANKIAKASGAFRLPNVPSLPVKLALGEMSDIILEGSAVSPEKIVQTGFNFKYPEINDELLNKLLN